MNGQLRLPSVIFLDADSPMVAMLGRKPTVALIVCIAPVIMAKLEATAAGAP